jgi:hypothetical protein
LYPILVARDGEFCVLCGRVGINKSLCIDHIDNNNNNNDLENLQILCRSCNTKKNPRGKHRPKNNSLEIETPNQSEEIRLNKKYEPVFREWVENQFKKYDSLLLKEVIDAGAEVTTASTQTIERYLRKMCSFAGVLEVFEEADKNKRVGYKFNRCSNFEHLKNDSKTEPINEINPV